MIDTEYSLETYIAEITPIVEEVSKEREIIREFSKRMDELRVELRKCDDNLSIYLAWQDSVGRKLHNIYNDHQLLELHNLPQCSINQDNIHFIIKQNDHVAVEFFYCQHNYYTPIRSRLSIHQCLECQ